jgi:hypothetical protein
MTPARRLDQTLGAGSEQSRAVAFATPPPATIPGLDLGQPASPRLSNSALRLVSLLSSAIFLIGQVGWFLVASRVTAVAAHRIPPGFRGSSAVGDSMPRRG